MLENCGPLSVFGSFKADVIKVLTLNGDDLKLAVEESLLYDNKEKLLC